MRRFALFALALALGAPACDDDNPIGPSNSGPIVFTAELKASNENPPIGNAESAAQGTVTITFSVPRDGSGNVTDAGVWNVQAALSGFTNDSFIRLAHIHNGPVGVNAGVFVDTRLTIANQIPLPGGAGTINFEGVQITQAQAQAVLNNPAGHYFNMHSPLNPGGAVRGQLVRVR
jgi:CHRD domain-containing protein